MRISRSHLYWGVFLVALGGTLVYAETIGVDEALVRQALALWPLLFVALGVALVLRRTQLSVAGGMLAAAVPGLLLGGAIAVGPDLGFDCGDGTPIRSESRDGTFSGTAEIDVTLDCGRLEVTTNPGHGWRFDFGNSEGRAPDIDASGDRLEIDGHRRWGWPGVGGRDEWRLALPTAPVATLDLTVNAGEGIVDLADAQIGGLSVTTNAGRSAVDLSGTAVGDLDATVNAGELAIELGADENLAGSLAVNAGSLKVCAPSELGLQVRQTGALASTELDGFVRNGSVWQSPHYASAVHHADLDVSVNLGNLEINPIGGCK